MTLCYLSFLLVDMPLLEELPWRDAGEDNELSEVEDEDAEPDPELLCEALVSFAGYM